MCVYQISCSNVMTCLNACQKEIPRTGSVLQSMKFISSQLLSIPNWAQCDRTKGSKPVHHMAQLHFSLISIRSIYDSFSSKVEMPMKPKRAYLKYTFSVIKMVTYPTFGKYALTVPTKSVSWFKYGCFLA